jgi:hypothetical protein
MDKEPRKQQVQQSLSQALLLSSRGLSLQGFSSIPGQQPPARMGPEEQQKHLLATIQFALDITSDVDDSFLESPSLLSSAPWPRHNDEEKRDKQ